MSLRRIFSFKTSLPILLSCLMVIPAAAGSISEELYADSFGNLVIHSPSGFKRILVGKGHLADEISHRNRMGPKVVYLEKRADGRFLRKSGKACRYGARLHGRSYMYGLPENVVPVPRVPCR